MSISRGAARPCSSRCDLRRDLRAGGDSRSGVGSRLGRGDARGRASARERRVASRRDPGASGGADRRGVPDRALRRRGDRRSRRRSSGNPAEPLVRALREVVGGEAADYVHYGATSQDIVDSAAMLVSRRALGLICEELDGVAAACAGLAEDTSADADGCADAAAAGRADDVRAQGGRLAGGGHARADPAARAARAASGTAGRRSRHARGARRRRARRSAGFFAARARACGAGASVARRSRERRRARRRRSRSQAGACAKIGLDVALLAQTEVGEVREPAGQGGSSTMPHKRNPGRLGDRGCVRAARSGGLRRSSPARSSASTSARSEPGRPSGGRSRTRSPTPAARPPRSRRTLDGLEVDVGRMRANLELTASAMSERLAFVLARTDRPRRRKARSPRRAASSSPGGRSATRSPECSPRRNSTRSSIRRPTSARPARSSTARSAFYRSDVAMSDHDRGMEVRREVLGDDARRSRRRADDAVHRRFPGSDHALCLGRDLVAPGPRPPDAKRDHAHRPRRARPPRGARAPPPRRAPQRPDRRTRSRRSCSRARSTAAFRLPTRPSRLRSGCSTRTRPNEPRGRDLGGADARSAATAAALSGMRPDDLAALAIARGGRAGRGGGGRDRGRLVRVREPGRRGQPQRRSDGGAARGPAGVGRRRDGQPALRLRALRGRRRLPRDRRGRRRSLRRRWSRVDVAGAARRRPSPTSRFRAATERSTTRRSAGGSRTRGSRRCSRSSRWGRPARTSPSAGASRARIRTPSPLESQRRWAAAQEAGRFADELVPVGELERDEHPRPGHGCWRSSRRSKPVFRAGGTVTAGNASGINDGAAALVIASEERARALGVEPLGAFAGSAVAGVDPRVMGIGPVPAVRKLLARDRDRRRGSRPRRAERGLRVAERRGDPRARARP